MDYDMIDLVDKMKHLSEYDKEVWRSIVANLSKTQNDMLNDLVDNVKKQVIKRTNPSTWHIVTAAIPKEELEEAQENGMFEILDTVCFSEKMKFEQLKRNDENDLIHYCSGISFLKCDYNSVFDEYLGRKYVAKVVTKNDEYEVNYSFEKYQGYLDVERVVERAAMQYEVDVPIIFEPISRRAIRIVVDLTGYKFSKSDDMYIDFQLDKNGLSYNGLIN